MVLFLLFFQKVKRLPPEGHSQSGSLFLFVTHRAVTAHQSRHLTDRQVISDGIPKAAARRAGAGG